MVGNLRELIPAFFVGPGGRPLSEEEIARRRQVAGSLLAQATDTSPTAGGGASVLAKAIQGLSYGINEGRADRAAAANAEAAQANIAAMLGGSGSTPYASAFPPAPSAGAAVLTGGAPDVASARVEQAHGNGAPIGGDLRGGIIETASALGIDPVDLATVISYETAGTFDPTKRGPTTQWGQHRGLIQFGEPQAKEYGVNWDDPVGSQLGANGAIANYLRKAGVTPGTGILDLYSAVNAGRVGRYNASDANNGGAPGTVRDKVERQMAGHRQKALSLLGNIAPTNAVAANEAFAAGQLQGGLTPAALNSWTAQNYNPAASLDRIAATGGAATPSTIGEADAREILAARPADASAYVGPGQLIAPSDIPGIMAPPDEGVIVAESPEDIAAAELAMNDPAFAGPAAAEIAPAVAPAPAPVVAPQVAQALTALPVNEALPMAGGVDNPRPIVPTAPQNPMQGLNPAVVQALSNPNATAQERAIAQSLLQQHVAQNQALQEQARKQAEQANMLAQRRGLAGRMGIDPNYAVDDTIWKAASDKAFRDAPSRAAGSYIERPDGTLEQVPLNPTGDIQNYEYYARKEIEAGRVPLSPLEYERELRKSGATSVTVGGDSAPGLGKLSPDYGYVLDPETRQPVIDPATGLPRSAPIPGSPAAIAAEQAAAEKERLAGAQTRSDADKAETTLDATGSVLDIMRDAETPATGTLSKPFALYSGTPAGRVRSYVKTLQSGVALGAMQRLKEMSATGATGFGALSAPELDLLINDIGALDPDNTEPEIFIKTVERIRDRSRRVAQDIAKNVSPERIQELGLQSFIDSFKATQDGGTGSQIPDGIDPSDWEFMTPEERRLFQ